MTTYVYRLSDGSLYSSGADGGPIASDTELAAKGMAKVTGLAPLDSTHAWDAATHSVISAIAPTPLRQLSVFEFANRFTGAEIAAMQASSSNGVKKFLFMLPLANAQTIDLNSQVIVNVMVLLVSQGILSQARSDAILS